MLASVGMAAACLYIIIEMNVNRGELGFEPAGTGVGTMMSFLATGSTVSSFADFVSRLRSCPFRPSHVWRACARRIVSLLRGAHLGSRAALHSSLGTALLLSLDAEYVDGHLTAARTLCPCLNTPPLPPLSLVKRGQSTYDYIKELRQKEAADSRNVEAARVAPESRRASRFSTQDAEAQEERGRCCCRPRPVSPEA